MDIDPYEEARADAYASSCASSNRRAVGADERHSAEAGTHAKQPRSERREHRVVVLLVSIWQRVAHIKVHERQLRHRDIKAEVCVPHGMEAAARRSGRRAVFIPVSQNAEHFHHNVRPHFLLFRRMRQLKSAQYL